MSTNIIEKINSLTNLNFVYDHCEGENDELSVYQIEKPKTKFDCYIAIGLYKKYFTVFYGCLPLIYNGNNWNINEVYYNDKSIRYTYKDIDNLFNEQAFNNLKKCARKFNSLL